MKKIIIIGSGPSALAACYKLQQNANNDITLITMDDELGKKYLVTGNGRCNIGNRFAFKKGYRCYISDKKFVESFFTRQDTINYSTYLTAARINLFADSENRLYPFSFSALNVQKQLVSLINTKVNVIYNTQITNVDYQNKVIIDSNDKRYHFDKLVIATGGLSALDSLKELIKDFNIKTIPFTPGLTSLVPDFTWPKRIIGQKVRGTLRLIKDDYLYEESGELLFKEKELSGIMMFNASMLADESTEISIDLKSYENQQVGFDEYLSYLPYKVAEVANLLPIKNGMLVFKTKKKTDFEHCQVAKGGISLSEIELENMSLKKYNDIHVIGEALDYTGLCGGFNLLFAIISGLRIE